MQASTTAVSHVGICVADIARSMRFYCEGLGFVTGVAMVLDDEQGAQLMGMPGPVNVKTQFMRLGPVALELIQFLTPDSMASMASMVPRPMNRIGFTHLSLRVADVDAIATRLTFLGGSIVEGSRICYDNFGIKGDVMFCLDPDRNLVELMNFPDAVQFY